MDTTIFLVRHGETDWHREGRVSGSRDIGLNADGINQSQAVGRSLEGLEVAEVLSSPQRRAAQTAEIIGGSFDLDITRDPRLQDFRVGRWEGMHYHEVLADPEYLRFLAEPLSERIPGGENLGDIRDRAVAAVQQALGDNPGGENVIMITHAGVIRVLLVHYLGMTLASYHRLRVTAGSLSILRFSSDRELPRVLAVNWLPGQDIGPLLR